MGWLSCDNWTPTTIRGEVLKDFSSRPDQISVLGVKSTKFGKHLWIALQSKKTGEKFIAFYLIEKMGGGWGYKDMDESMGLYEKDCPLELLDAASPGPTDECSIKWRESVRKHHAKRKSNTAGLKPGMVIVVYGNRYELIEKIKRSWRAKCISHSTSAHKIGCTFHIRPSQIERFEETSTEAIVNILGGTDNAIRPSV